jgi:hypothetical protein
MIIILNLKFTFPLNNMGKQKYLFYTFITNYEP